MSSTGQEAPSATVATSTPTPPTTTAASTTAPEVTIEEVAKFLLAKDYTLSALELFQESIEAGLPPVHCLREHFLGAATAPTALTPSEKGVATAPTVSRRTTSKGGQLVPSHHRDSSSGGVPAPEASVAKQLKERDDRVSLLEYELRIAREDLDAARAQIKQLKDTSSATASAGATSQSSLSASSSTVADEAAATGTGPMSEAEFKALHFIVKRHLMANRLSMTAITLAEELKASDIDGWDEAGIDGLANPPELIAIYRSFIHKAVYVPSGFKERVEALQREVAVLQQVSKENEQQIAALKSDKFALEKKLADARAAAVASKQAEAKRERAPSNAAATPVQSPAPITPIPVAAAVSASAVTAAAPSAPQPAATGTTATPMAAPTAAAAAETKKDEKEQPKQPTPTTSGSPASQAKDQSWQAQFKTSRRDKNAVQLRARPSYESRLAQMVRRLSELEEDSDGVIRVLSESLPYLVRGVIIAKREELIPLFLCTVQRHPDRDTRLAMTSLFFNLIKRPDEQQRALIVEGFMALASMVGPSRTTEELLEQCVLEVGGKYEERRILVAETCSSLAPFTSPAVRTGQILLALTTLLQDKSSSVRVAAVKNLASLVTYFSDDSKLLPIQSEISRLLHDVDDSVVASTLLVLVVAVVDWADAVGKLHSVFVSFFIEQARNFFSQVCNFFLFWRQKTNERTMRITTMLLVICVVTFATAMIAAIVGIAVLSAAQRAFRASHWSVVAMRIDSLDYFTDSLHLKLTFFAEASQSNKTRASPKLAVAGGTTSAWVGGKLVGNGTFGSFTITREVSRVQLIVDQAGVPLDRGDVLKRFVSGEEVEIVIRVRSMKFLIVPIGVNITAVASLSIDNAPDASQSTQNPWDG